MKYSLAFTTLALGLPLMAFAKEYPTERSSNDFPYMACTYKAHVLDSATGEFKDLQETRSIKVTGDNSLNSVDANWKFDFNESVPFTGYASIRSHFMDGMQENFEQIFITPSGLPDDAVLIRHVVSNDEAKVSNFDIWNHPDVFADLSRSYISESGESFLLTCGLTKAELK